MSSLPKLFEFHRLVFQRPPLSQSRSINENAHPPIVWPQKHKFLPRNLSSMRHHASIKQAEYCHQIFTYLIRPTNNHYSTFHIRLLEWNEIDFKIVADNKNNRSMYSESLTKNILHLIRDRVRTASIQALGNFLFFNSISEDVIKEQNRTKENEDNKRSNWYQDVSSLFWRFYVCNICLRVCVGIDLFDSNI